MRIEERWYALIMNVSVFYFEIERRNSTGLGGSTFGVHIHCRHTNPVLNAKSCCLESKQDFALYEVNQPTAVHSLMPCVTTIR